MRHRRRWGQLCPNDKEAEKHQRSRFSERSWIDRVQSETNPATGLPSDGAIDAGGNVYGQSDSGFLPGFDD